MGLFVENEESLLEETLRGTLLFIMYESASDF